MKIKFLLLLLPVFLLTACVRIYLPDPKRQTATPDVEQTAAPSEKPETQEPKEGADGNGTVQYKIYSNGRYGYSIPYPDSLIPQQEAGNSSGREFISQDGDVVLTVGGSHTPSVFEEAATLDGYYQFILNELDYEPTYQTKGSNFFVFSGYRGDKVVYQRHFLKSDGTENGFVIEYPVSKREQYDDITTYISMNMKTGVGADSPAEK